MSYVEILKRAQILQGLSAEQLEGVLAANQIATFQHNEAVFEEDSCGREMYIVLEGEVAVEVDPAKLGTVEKGSTEKQIIRKFGCRRTCLTMCRKRR
jgi:signal-transduction protein with cAMP-binding, CBS, and nucleotidyltransferase domain